MRPVATTPVQASHPLTLLWAAPHRAMFFVGAVALLTNMLWWTWVLLAGWRGWSMASYALPPAIAHGLLLQYTTLAPFVLGFLLTVFPRWLELPAVSRGIYVVVFGLTLCGGLLILAAQNGLPATLPFGLCAMLLGWLTAMTVLGRCLGRRSGDMWAVSSMAALAFGGLGLALALLYALGGGPTVLRAAVDIGTFGLLLPIYFTVAHRMVPFFSSNVITGYRVVRPAWSLWCLWGLSLAHLAIELCDGARWRWLADLPLTGVLLWQWLAWQPWKARKPGLLAVLYIALAWLPLSIGLFAAESLSMFLTHAGAWARAPLHALTIGFFSSMLVAMVTRVTHGHSGRPLAMGVVPWFAFVGIQIIAVVRVLADTASQPWPWYLLAATLWLLALAPWVARSLWIYLTPRHDGKPG
jgi:uncharacterized protein involved in response to NO